MASKDLDTGVINPSKGIVESESELKQEVLRLKGQMAEIYQAWIRGHPPPSFPANYTVNPPTISPLSQIQILTAVDITPQPFHTLPTKTTSYPTSLTTHIFVSHPPTTFPRSSSAIVFKIPDAQHHAPEPIFKVSGPYSYTPHFEPPGETAKSANTVEQDEISKKLKGFKMPKFDLYDGRGDPVAHLRGYCSEMKSVGGKDELLIVCFSESLTGATLEWHIRQDVSKWHTWDDMAQDFV